MPKLVEQELLLEVKGCSKSFPGVKAFNKVDFDLYAGEIHCVVGENGAGKSTFIKMLSGALRPDEGIITIGGQQYSHLTPALAHQLGIQTIYQEISLAPDLTVAENIFMGAEPITRFGYIDYPKLKRESKATPGQSENRLGCRCFCRRPERSSETIYSNR